MLLSIKIQDIDESSRHTYKLWVLGVTSILTRLPTIVARPRPPPPEELYKKVGYTPIASSLNIQPYRVSSFKYNRGETSEQQRFKKLYKPSSTYMQSTQRKASACVTCPPVSSSTPEATATVDSALLACTSPLIRNTQTSCTQTHKHCAAHLISGTETEEQKRCMRTNLKYFIHLYTTSDFCAIGSPGFYTQRQVT